MSELLTRSECVKLLDEVTAIQPCGEVQPSLTAHRGFYHACRPNLERALRAYVELRLDFANLLHMARARAWAHTDDDRALLDAIARDHARYLEGS